jgi:hypothetical protein
MTLSYLGPLFFSAFALNCASRLSRRRDISSTVVFVSRASRQGRGLLPTLGKYLARYASELVGQRVEQVVKLGGELVTRVLACL